MNDSRLGMWEMALLGLLSERPMHPYEMQQLLAQRRKDKVLGLKKGSLYHAIGRLERWELIRALGADRAGNRPERTTYEITLQGSSRLSGRLKALLAESSWESSSFMASLSFLVYLRPEAALPELESRLKSLDEDIAARDQELAGAMGRAGRINLLESEYAVAMLRAERAWVAALTEDIKNERLRWDLAQILGIQISGVQS